MQNGRFEPIHEAHAIEQVVFVLQFEMPLGEPSFLQAREAANQFKDELPGIQEIRGFSFVIGSGAPTRSEPASGVSFRSVERDGTVAHELRIERASVTFVTNLYSRWDAIWQQASKYFNTLAPIYAAQSNLVGVSINYVDKFVWSGDLVGCDPNLLLRAQSKYLCPHVYEAEDFWHSHTGAFSRIDASTKRLLNVNVDYLDENRVANVRRIVAITTGLTDQFNQLDYQPSVIGQDQVNNFIDSHMQQLHMFGKEVFGNIINETMSKRIALTE